MKNKLLNIVGIDNIENINFKWILEDKLEGVVNFKDKEFMDISIAKDIISHKIIESIEDSNFDNLNIYNNIIILNVKFNLAIEYSNCSNSSRLNLLKHSITKTFTGSLLDYSLNNVEIEIFIVDFKVFNLEDNLHYYVNILFGINEV